MQTMSTMTQEEPDGLSPLAEVPVFALTSSEVWDALLPSTPVVQTTYSFGKADDAIERAVQSVASSGLGRIPLQELDRQLERLPLSFDEKPRSFGDHATDVLLGSLRRLAARFLEWRGETVFLVDGRRLEFQSLLGRVLPEQIAAASSVLIGPGQHGDTPLPSSRAMNRGRRRGKNQALIPTPAGTYLRKLRREGLPELHRHHNGSTYPLLIWPDLLRSADDVAEYVRNNNTTTDFQAQIRSITGDAVQPLHEQVYRVLQGTRRLRAELFRYLSWNDDDDRSASRDSDKDTPASGKELYRALKAIKDRRAYLDLSSRRPIPRTRPMTAYLDRPGGRDSSIENKAERERGLIVDVIYTLAVNRSKTEDKSSVDAAAHSRFALAAYGYFILQNRLLSAIVQPADDAEGLARFTSQFFDHPFREAPGSPDDTLRFKQASTIGAVDWLEIRQSPRGDPFEKLRTPWKAVERLRAPSHEGTSPLMELLNEKSRSRTAQKERLRKTLLPDPETNTPGVATIFHFIRQSGSSMKTFDGLGLSTRWADGHNSVRDGLVHRAYRLREAARHPVLSAAFVGLDVAALETDAPVGVFAPTIRWLRSLASTHSQLAWQRTRHFQNRHVPRLGVTCHAGEDFRHLFAGIRSVDESVRFLDMKQGDRIGHALALGISPEQWADRLGGTMTMTVCRRFFDLVWFYDHLRSLPGHASVTEQVRSEIRRLAHQLYPSSAFQEGRTSLTELPSCEILTAARRFHKLDPRLTDLRVAVHPYARFGRREINHAKQQLGDRAYDLWLYHMHDREFARRTKIVDQFTIRPEWFEATRAVQRAVMDEMTRREVAIEINPTSNRAIGGLDCLSEHPVFDWSPPSGDVHEDRPYVVVGSDDPGVFGTELLHEYAFLHAAARKRGHSRDVVEGWLETLREHGLRFLFMPHRRDPSMR